MEREIEVEFERLRLESETSSGQRRAKINRFIVRTAQIVLGLAIGLGAFLFINDGAQQFRDTPLGGLTLGALSDRLFQVAVSIPFFWLAFKLVFGVFKKSNPWDKLRSRARANVEASRAKRTADDAAAASLAAHYEKSRLNGILHDPNLGLGDRPFLAWVVMCALYFGAVGLIVGAIMYFQR